MKHRPGPIIWTLLIAATLCAVVVVTILIREAMQEDDLPPTSAPLATVAGTPTITPAPATPTANASPTATDEGPLPGSLTDLMQYAPDRLDDGSLPLPEVATYADVQAWFTMQAAATPVTGVPSPVLTGEPATDLALPPVIANRALDPIWEATYGFSLADIDQILAIGQSPDYIFIMRGNFDPDGLRAAWVASSYQAVAYKGMTFWTAFPGDTIDLSNPASRPAMGSLNNLLLVDNHTLIAAAKYSRIEDVIKVYRGEQDSLADNDRIAPLLDVETGNRRFVTAVVARGELVESAPIDERRAGAQDQQHASAEQRPQPAATPAANLMPQVRMCLFGLMIDVPDRTGTPVATPVAGTAPALTIALSFDDGDAVTTARGHIRQRFQQEVSSMTGRPWAMDYALVAWKLRDEDVLVLGLSPVTGEIDWLRLMDDRDFTFLTWNDADA